MLGGGDSPENLERYYARLEEVESLKSKYSRNELHNQELFKELDELVEEVSNLNKQIKKLKKQLKGKRRNKNLLEVL